MEYAHLGIPQRGGGGEERGRRPPVTEEGRWAETKVDARSHAISTASSRVLRLAKLLETAEERGALRDEQPLGAGREREYELSADVWEEEIWTLAVERQATNRLERSGCSPTGPIVDHGSVFTPE